MITYSNNCKCFWSFIKRLRRGNSGISSLRTESGIMITSNDNIAYILPSNHPSITFSVDEIQKLLQELKHGKALGPDNIPTWILQTCSAEIAPVLQVIFTQSLKTHMLSKDRSSLVNYRPISLTSVCCKIMEHVIFSFISPRAIQLTQS